MLGASTYSLGFPLFSDNDGSVAETYGVPASERLQSHRRVAKRSTFALDSDLTVRYIWVTDDPGVVPEKLEER
ncbi:redoxin domain-containing protein [Natrialbaceae archaeon A-gly3]